MEIVEARVERLEAALEGLQDAIHRQAVLRDEQIDELDRRGSRFTRFACALNGERESAESESLVGVGDRELHANDAEPERGQERIGVRVADVEADHLAAPGLEHGVRATRRSRTTCAPSRTLSTLASSRR